MWYTLKDFHPKINGTNDKYKLDLVANGVN
jgi:hypothetical protein